MTVQADVARARADLARARYVQPAQDALRHLRQALAYSKEAKSRETVKVIRLAISSAKGAVRAADYRAQREA